MLRGILISIMVLILLILLAVMLTYFINSMLIAAYKTGINLLPLIIDAMKLKDNEVFMDLGSGDARVLIAARKKSKIRGIGIEISPFTAMLSRFRIWQKVGFVSNIQIKCENFLRSDISQADVIYCNLNSTALLLLKEKFATELKKGARVYSLGVEIPEVKFTEKTDVGDLNLYMYKKADFK